MTDPIDAKLRQEIDSLKEKLAKRITLHDRDGRALFNAHREIDALRQEVETLKYAAERWRQIAKEHEREKADLVAFASRFSVIQRCPKCGNPSDALENINIDDVVRDLNEMVKADPKAMNDLVETRVECTGFDEFGYVKCDMGTDNVLCVGFLGVLNGLFGNWGNGPIAAVFEHGKLVEFTLARQEW